MKDPQEKLHQNTRHSYKKMKSLSIESEIIVNEHERHFILAAASGVTYDIEINNSPNCTCKYCYDRDVCSHITWLLLNHLKSLKMRAYCTSGDILVMS